MRLMNVVKGIYNRCVDSLWDYKLFVGEAAAARLRMQETLQET